MNLTIGLNSHQCLPITITLLWQIKQELAKAPDLLLSDKLMLWLVFTFAFTGIPCLCNKLQIANCKLQIQFQCLSSLK